MNYAEDRIDRRYREGTLWKDYQQALKQADHELLARTLRDTGWNRRSVFHYASAWCESPSSWKAAGDYAQAAEMVGFPEIGIVALLCYHSKGKLRAAAPFGGQILTKDDSTWLQQKENEIKGDCGCGMHADCGRSTCSIPMEKQSIEKVLRNLAEYCYASDCFHSKTTMSANEILKRAASFFGAELDRQHKK